MSLKKTAALLCSIFFVNTSFGMHGEKVEPTLIPGLEVIYSLMGRGKTESLILAGKKAKKEDKNVLSVFHHFELGRQEEKEEKGFYSYNGKFLKASSVKSGKEILEKFEALKKKGKKPDLVLADEGQFFMDDETLLPAIKTMTSQNATVKIAGLLHTFLKKGFGPMPELVKKAEFVYELPMGKCVVCKTKDAKWMQRIIIEKNENENNIKKPASRKDPIILVGKEDCYERRCDKCHIILD